MNLLQTYSITRTVSVGAGAEITRAVGVEGLAVSD